MYPHLLSKIRHLGCRRGSYTKGWVRFWIGCLFLCLAPSVGAEDDIVAFEHEVKAAMLYKFLGYIEWPASVFPSDKSPYIIAVIGAEAVAEELRDITEHRTVNNRPVEVWEMESLRAVRDVHMLFIGREENYRLGYLLEATRNLPIVTVTESEDGLEEGGIINLRVVEGRMKFDVSLASTEKGQLRFSARMLAVASTVKKGGT